MIKRLKHGSFHIGPISSPQSISALGFASGLISTLGLDIRADMKTAM